MYGQSRILLVLHIPLSPSSVTVRRCVPRRKLFDSHSAWVGSWSLWGSLCFILRFFWWCPLASLCPLRCLKGLHVGTSRLGLFFCPVKQDCGKIRNHINKFFWKMSDIVFECHVEESSKTMPEANFVQVVCFCSCLLCTNKKDT